MFIANFRLKTAVQKFLSLVVEAVDFPLLHPRRELLRRAISDSVDYISGHAHEALAMDTARDVMVRALQAVEGVPGEYVEFGVYKGGTLNFIAKRRPTQRIWGFDNFEGLPENWTGNASDFNAGGKPPSVRSNVSLVRGWFDRSLPGWLAEQKGPIAFVHVDCDIYSSTKIIFDAIGSRLAPGAVIVFDEYFGYPGWRHHEFKAFQEFVAAHQIQYQYLCFARVQCAVKIIRNPLFVGS
jgi:hypothetical protein